jgi:hypothetical protein
METKAKLFVKKVVLLLLSLLVILSVTAYGVPLALAADDETTQQNEEYKGNPGSMPDLSELISKKQALSEAEKKMSTSILQLADEKYLDQRNVCKQSYRWCIGR